MEELNKKRKECKKGHGFGQPCGYCRGGDLGEVEEGVGV